MIKYEVYSLETGDNITSAADWCIAPNGKLFLEDNGDSITDETAIAFAVNSLDAINENISVLQDIVEDLKAHRRERYAVGHNEEE